MGEEIQDRKLLSEELYRALKHGYWNPPTSAVPEDATCASCADLRCADMVANVPDAPACAHWTDLQPNYDFNMPSAAELLALLLAEHEERLGIGD
jgi:hypothetical protein